MADKRDLQQIKVKPLPKSPPASAITYSEYKKRQGSAEKSQSIPKAAK